MSKKIVIKYLGNSAFQITTEGGKNILIDPCLTGAIAPGGEREGATKFTPDAIQGIDVIFVTHGAADHMGDTYELAARMGSHVVCDPAVTEYLTIKGLPGDRIKTVVWGMKGEVRGVKFQTVCSAHISFLKQPGVPPLTGCPNGYIIYSESDRGVYHPGDTAIFSDLELFGRLYKPEIGLLGIGGFTRYLAELSTQEAALIVKWMNLKAVIPHHYPPGSPLTKEFKKAVKKESPETRVIVLDGGDEVRL